MTDHSLVGKVAFVCDHCKKLIWWMGPDHELEEMVQDLRECDAMQCPACGKINEITDDVREMLL